MSGRTFSPSRQYRVHVPRGFSLRLTLLKVLDVSLCVSLQYQCFATAALHRFSLPWFRISSAAGRRGFAQMRPHGQSDVSSDEERDSQDGPSRHGDSDSADHHEAEQRPLRKKGKRRKKKVGAKITQASRIQAEN